MRRHHGARSARWLNMVVQATNRRTSTQKMQLAFGAGHGLVFGIESIAVLGLGASMAIGGTLTVGMLMAFISYKDEFSSRMQRFIDNLMAVRMLRLHVERLSDIVLSEPEQLGDARPYPPDASVGPRPTITLDKVSFRYGSGTPWVLRHIHIEIGAGEHVAIVGATGCGKTTLAKIILGLLEPTEGCVRVDGVPLRQFGLSNWRRQVAAVMQEDQLFSASLQENIAGFDETVDHSRPAHDTHHDRAPARNDRDGRSRGRSHGLIGAGAKGLSKGLAQPLNATRATMRLVAGSSCPRHRLSAGDDEGPSHPRRTFRLPLLTFIRLYWPDVHMTPGRADTTAPCRALVELNEL